MTTGPVLLDSCIWLWLVLESTVEQPLNKASPADCGEMLVNWSTCAIQCYFFSGGIHHARTPTCRMEGKPKTCFLCRKMWTSSENYGKLRSLNSDVLQHRTRIAPRSDPKMAPPRAAIHTYLSTVWMIKCFLILLFSQTSEPLVSFRGDVVVHTMKAEWGISHSMGSVVMAIIRCWYWHGHNG